MSKAVSASAIKALQKELVQLNTTPVEGFKVNPSDVENMLVWDVAIFGPPLTLYEGGYFKARLVFPPDYPYNPPSMQFLTKMFHPNIYENGHVCISILHTPGDDPQSGELASERWNPTQNVRTILLSVISLLNEPNINSAAHVEASVSFRRWKDSGGVDSEYSRIVRGLVRSTHKDAERDGVHVPTSLEEYCVSGRPADVSPGNNSDADRQFSDFDDYYSSDEDYDVEPDLDGEDGDSGVRQPRDSSSDPSQTTSAGHSVKGACFSGVTDAGVDSALEETDTVGDVLRSGRKHLHRHKSSTHDTSDPLLPQSSQAALPRGDSTTQRRN